MQCRQDIQILRGIAVILVVLFHLDLAGFRSGFLGVDVFFVISGYLMAQLYDPEDILGFFAKRARRLLPAYFTVLLATLCATLFVTAPGDYNQVATQSSFAALFASNIGFWAENSYFDKTAFKPLLHFWSLGVELQFYLCVPLLSWLFRKTRVAYPLLLAGSLLACAVVISVSPKTAFFWLPFRLWEFLIGFGLGARKSSIAHKNWIGLLALVGMLGTAILPMDGQALGFVHGHPGLHAALISLMTAGILAFGLPRTIERIAVSLGKLGDYSYSIYLVHFPVIVLVLYQPFSGTILKGNPGQVILILLLTAAGSVLLYRAIERPMRQANRQRMMRQTLVAIFVTLAIAPIGRVRGGST